MNPLASCTNNHNGLKRLQVPQPIFVGNKEGRRWLICLNHEYDKVRASLEYLKQAQGLCYDGTLFSPSFQ